MGQKGSKKEHKILSILSKVNSFAVKCYDEQLPYGWEVTKQAIRALNKTEMYALAIRHDRDEQADGIWKIALEKPHYHIIVKIVDRKKKIRICQILAMLYIQFRENIDDSILANHGLESIGSFTGYAMYLTHETEDAIADNKEIYDISEIVSNLSEDEIKCIRSGYIRISDTNEKVTASKMAQLDKDAFNLGHELGNFTNWYNAQPFSVRSNSKIKTIKESYDRGVQSKLEEGREINRLCVYIQGEPNTGKTYAVEQTLNGKQILKVGGGGTGKFDNLRPDHEVIVIDDDICPNLLNMTDNYICRAYRRNSNNPVWAGQYFIVTSNLMFDEWLLSCGIKNATHKNAIATRFYICTIERENDVSRLALSQPSTRGSIEMQVERADRFVGFQKKFNEVIAQYRTSVTGVNYDSIIDKKYRQGNQVETIMKHMQTTQNCVLGKDFVSSLYADILDNAKQYEESKSMCYQYCPPHGKGSD